MAGGSCLEVVQCRQFDPVSGPFSMSNERNEETQSVYTVGSQRNLVPIRSRRAYLKRRSQVPSLLVIVLLFLAASLLVVVVILSIMYARNRGEKLCDTEHCVRIAASLKESMDTSVDPCDDFYTYACGRWPREHPIPDTSLTNSWFNERTGRVSRRIRELLRENATTVKPPWAVNQAKILYRSCMDLHAIDDLGLGPLFDLFETLELPAIPAAFTGRTADYVAQMARVKRILGRDVLFGLDVIPDPRNKSNNILLLDVPSTGSPFPNDKELEKRLQSIRSRLKKLEDRAKDEEEQDDDDDDDDDDDTSRFEDAELAYMRQAIKYVISNGTTNSCSSDEDLKLISNDRLDTVVETIHELDNTFYFLATNVANDSLSLEDISDSDYMLVDDLQRLTDEYVAEVNSSLTSRPIWRSFIESLFDGVVRLDLKGRDKILIGNLSYLKDVALALSYADEDVIETYIWWVITDMAAPHSLEGLRKIWSSYIGQIMNVEVRESKSLHCASAVNELMGMAVSWLFVDPKFHESKGPRVLEMLDDIKEAFGRLVMNTDWMDRRTKLATMEKNRKMRSEIGYPMWLFDDGALDEYYEGIDLEETSYLANMVQIVRLISLANLETLHEANFANESYWATDPTDVNAFHSFHANQITIPEGILQFPFYELGLEALNYGAIGTVLGHELTHGFDNSGRHYDSDGNLRQWWTNETIHEYTARTDCFIKHYSGYYEDQVDDYIDGELTLGENIADNGGLREAVIAYQRWKARHGREPLLPGFTHLTHEQLLFLSYAHLWCESYTATSLHWMLQDSHCPGHVRLQAVLKNSEEFSRAWNCPLGSKMNPRNKCHVW